MNKKAFQTAIEKATEVYLPMVSTKMEENQIVMTDYQKQCVMSAISIIDGLLKDKEKEWNQVDQRSVSDALTQTATLQLNPAASPAEVYYITRNTNIKGNWIQQIEMGIEGDGNDSLLARFGRDVKTVHKFWEVREEDEFSMLEYNGLELTPPRWKPTGRGKVIKVIYPISKTNGDVEYLISEREHVDKNLKAHISNNLMNETFGIAESRYKANAEQKKQIDAKKQEIKAIYKDMTLDEMLSDERLEPYISVAWKSPHSSESMIVRKMRNNAVKKYPKNFENAFLARAYMEADEETTERRDVTEKANQELIDFEDVEIVENVEVERVNPDVEKETQEKVEIIDVDIKNNQEHGLSNEEIEELKDGMPEQEILFDDEPGY